MTKIKYVRLALKNRYLEVRLAGRAGLTLLRASAQDCDPSALTCPAGHPLGPWVLPSHPGYTGTKVADVAVLRYFLTAFSCFFGFGSGIWADAR